MKSDPLWTCPKCGHAFVSRNLWHSCARYDLDDHFRGRPPGVRRLFDRFRAMVEACGPVTMYAQKTRIVFMVRVRFASVTVRARSIRVGFWLPRLLDDPTFTVEVYGPRAYGYYRVVDDETGLDDRLQQYLREARAVGCQEHHAG